MVKCVDQLNPSRLRITAVGPRVFLPALRGEPPRGKHRYNGASGKGGPDATFVHPNGDITHVDASGFNPHSHAHQQRATHKITTEAQTNFHLVPAGLFTKQQAENRTHHHPGMYSIDHRD